MRRCGAKTASHLGQGGTSWGFAAMTDYLVWVLEPENPTSALRTTPPRDGIFRERKPKEGVIQIRKGKKRA
jgi:hypothetical protein